MTGCCWPGELPESVKDAGKALAMRSLDTPEQSWVGRPGWHQERNVEVGSRTRYGVGSFCKAYQPNSNIRPPEMTLRFNASECVDCLIVFRELAMRNSVDGYGEHYHAARPNQGFGNELIVPLQPLPLL